MNLFEYPLYLFVALLAVSPVVAQDTARPPVAQHGNRPGIVISPFAAGKEIDITGLAPGSLARDPHTSRIFEIPSPPISTAPSPGTHTSVTNKKSTSQNPQTNGVPRTETPPVVPPSRDLAAFVKGYLESGESNDAASSADYYAPKVSNYFGRKGLTREKILADRVSYLRRYPTRSYRLRGEPRILSVTGSQAIVEATFDYTVANNAGTYTGSSTTLLTARNHSGGWQIVSVEEKDN